MTNKSYGLPFQQEMGLAPEKERPTVWRSVLQVFPNPMLCELDHIMSLLENKHATKFILQHMISQLARGVLKLSLTFMPGKGQSAEMLRKTGWSLKEEEKFLSPVEEWLPISLPFIMNIIAWNNRGALKPNFQSHVRELVCVHDPAIFVVMETRLGGARAKDITDRLLSDGVIHTETIGFASGLWLLWNSDKVEVSLLAKIEQEIHVTIKVRSSNLSWLFSAIYASPRFAKRSVLWNNLISVAESHRMPWIIAGNLMSPSQMLIN